jgi:hypothetical protein
MAMKPLTSLQKKFKRVDPYPGSQRPRVPLSLSILPSHLHHHTRPPADQSLTRSLSLSCAKHASAERHIPIQTHTRVDARLRRRCFVCCYPRVSFRLLKVYSFLPPSRGRPAFLVSLESSTSLSLSFFCLRSAVHYSAVSARPALRSASPDFILHPRRFVRLFAVRASEREMEVVEANPGDPRERVRAISRRRERRLTPGLRWPQHILACARTH